MKTTDNQDSTFFNESEKDSGESGFKLWGEYEKYENSWNYENIVGVVRENGGGASLGIVSWTAGALPLAYGCCRVEGLPIDEFCTEELYEYGDLVEKMLQIVPFCIKYFWKWIDSDSF